MIINYNNIKETLVHQSDISSSLNNSFYKMEVQFSNEE